MTPPDPNRKTSSQEASSADKKLGEPDSGAGSKLRFTWMEFSGSLGDLGLFIPLVVAMTIACELDIGLVLIAAGLMNVLTGLIFRQPIPVQPMKAIAAVAITEGLARGELIAAGLLMGVLLVALSPMVNQINRFVPRPVVRGIQLGVGLKLALGAITGFRGMEERGVQDLPWIGWDSILTAVLVTVFLLVMIRRRRQPASLYVFGIGFLVLFLANPEAYSAARFSAPAFSFHWPGAGSEWSGGLLKGALPQLPLTLLNSVIAVCALSGDYFPGRGIAPRKMAASVGLMNLVCVPLGGIPMCHGAGGLAAQFRFVARSGGSVVMLGVLKIAAGLAFGGALLSLLQFYPVAILGPMLIMAGLTLAGAARSVIPQARGIIVAATTALVILRWGTLEGFLAGMTAALLWASISRIRTRLALRSRIQ